jgi:hypothetical protein
MSWLFSQALVVEYSVEKFSGGEQCAQLNVMLTQQPYLRNDKTMDYSKPFLFGLTCERLTADHGAALLTSYLAAFHVRTSASQGGVRALPARARACGKSQPVSLAKFDRISCTWKTAQQSLFEDSTSCSVTWPRSGMTVDGQCWELPMSVRGINATASGLLQTLVADDAVNRKAGKFNSRGEPKLSAQVMLVPTLTRADATGGPGSQGRQGGMSLRTAIQKMPTLTAQDAKNNGAPSQMERNTKPLNAEIGGPLNPEWCEWFMGFPIGWTELKPWAMHKFHSAPQQHGECLREHEA